MTRTLRLLALAWATAALAACGSSEVTSNQGGNNSPPPPGSQSLTLDWDANTEPDLAGYKVYRSTTQGVYGTPIASVSAGTTTFTASGLQTGTTYYFVVTAYNTSFSESAHSNEVSKAF